MTYDRPPWRTIIVAALMPLLSCGAEAEGPTSVTVAPRCVAEGAPISRSNIQNPSNNRRVAVAARVLTLSNLPVGKSPLEFLGPFATQAALNQLVGREFEFSVASLEPSGFVVAFDTEEDMRATACALEGLDEFRSVKIETVGVTGDAG